MYLYTNIQHGIMDILCTLQLLDNIVFISDPNLQRQRYRIAERPACGVRYHGTYIRTCCAPMRENRSFRRIKKSDCDCSRSIQLP